VATGIRLSVAITHAGDGSGRLFITGQDGRVRILKGGKILSKPFLNISQRVSCCGEQGLLSIAFHPKYKTNGHVFVNYTRLNGDTVIARYTVSSNPDVIDAVSRRTILTIAQPFDNHNGGQLQFGPDSYLYIGMGDGGSGGDPDNRAQKLNTLLGKMLRIDIDGGLPYQIPPDNPFVGRAGAKPEIWARGLRNPWRFSFDRLTGHLFIGDVGQKKWEEVDLQSPTSKGGENYGWRRMEGKHCFNPSSNCNTGGLRLPIIEYSHSQGCSITGGYRYRGAKLAKLRGYYLYADFCSGRIWGARFRSGIGWRASQLRDTDFSISAFGEDQAGEIHFADLNTGAVYRISGFTP
jgi:glucose/arabinose dehydrogenase